MRHSVIFLVNLLQDVNVLRPLAYLAVREMGLPISFMLSHKFLERDQTGLWQQELREIDAELRAPSAVFHDEFEAMIQLEGKSGFLVAGSESSLSAHGVVRNVFRIAPPGLTRITLQHGFECVGFRQSRDQDIAHGRGITFSADIVCGWFDAARMNAMAATQRPKLHVTGPPMALQTRRWQEGTPRDAGGFVCENLHSPRFKAAGDFQADFMGTFTAFCAALQARGEKVVLRPHPGGQYVLKNNVALPENVVLETAPIYKIDLSRYSYGISAPSSILLDMVLAGIPTAVWHDGGAVMDVGNYSGLTVISSVQEWLDFAREAQTNPGRFIQRQRGFLEAQGMPIDPQEVQRRFKMIFGAPTAQTAGPMIHAPAMDDSRRSTAPPALKAVEHLERVLFVANAFIPTLQLSFVKPLALLEDSGQLQSAVVTEEQMKELFGRKLRDEPAKAWVEQRLSEFDPSIVVFCRYSGPHAELMIAWARARNIPVLFHIDDDLLNIPRELGEAKFKTHNHPLRLATVSALLHQSDFVYASTPRLRQRLEELGCKTSMLAGKIYASGRVMRPAVDRPARKIGYMGFDHAHDLELVLPALVSVLRRNPDVQFELFGSIPKPQQLDEFGERITLVPPVRNYEAFLDEFAAREWDIGICPLADLPFNVVKANTKWVEYTAVGAAVVASRNMVYDECCAGDCGMLVSTHDEWVHGLETLIREPGVRFAHVRRSQEKLTREYSTDALREQVLTMFDHAKKVTTTRKSDLRVVIA